MHTLKSNTAALTEHAHMAVYSFTYDVEVKLWRRFCGNPYTNNRQRQL